MEIRLLSITEWHILKLYVKNSGPSQAITASKIAEKRLENGLGVEEFVQEL